MKDHFRYVCFKTFPMVQRTFDLDKVYPMYFLVKHLRSCSLGQLNPFLLKEVALPSTT